MSATRDQIDSAVGSVLFNAINYPERIQSRVLGGNMAPLRNKVVAAVVEMIESNRNLHFECDCVPNLGPSHCHGCTDEGDGPIVEWSKSRHTEADRQLALVLDSLDALHENGTIQTGIYSSMHDRVSLALAAIEAERKS